MWRLEWESAAQKRHHFGHRLEATTDSLGRLPTARQARSEAMGPTGIGNFVLSLLRELLPQQLQRLLVV